MFRRLAFLIVSLAVFGAGCDGPCRMLAERQCECLPNSIERAACQRDIETNGNVQQPTEEEERICEDLLETCTCEALEREERAACGLTKPRET